MPCWLETKLGVSGHTLIWIGSFWQGLPSNCITEGTCLPSYSHCAWCPSRVCFVPAVWSPNLHLLWTLLCQRHKSTSALQRQTTQTPLNGSPLHVYCADPWLDGQQSTEADNTKDIQQLNQVTDFTDTMVQFSDVVNNLGIRYNSQLTIWPARSLHSAIPSSLNCDRWGRDQPVIGSRVKNKRLR